MEKKRLQSSGLPEEQKTSQRIRAGSQGIVKTLFGGDAWRTWLLIPLCLLLCLGMYYAAYGISRIRFRRALAAVDTREVTTRIGMEYYNRLTAREQMIWDAVKDAAEDHDERTRILPFPPTGEEFSHAMQAVYCDLPALFCLDIGGCRLQTSEHTGAVELSYYPEGDTGHAALLATAGALVSEALTAGDEYAAALALHDALTARAAVASGEEALPVSGAYAALALGRADSFGYAAAYKLLCYMAEIPCQIVIGSVDGVPHAWNCITADGMVGYVDVMWDDCRIDDMHLPFHGYYFLTYAEMAEDHTADTPALWQAGEPDKNFYRYTGRAADGEETFSAVLEQLLRSARASGEDHIEVLLPAAMSDETLEAQLYGAVAVVNADPEEDMPRLRTACRIYRTASQRTSCTVQLFYVQE